FVVEAAAAPLAEDIDWDVITIRSCTFDPGGVRADGTVIQPLAIQVTGRVHRLVIEQSIVGPIFVAGSGIIDELVLTDSIITAAPRAAPDSDGRQAAIVVPIGVVDMKRTTVLGDVHGDVITATDCLVTGMVVAADVQHSCFRFSAASLSDVPPGGTPRLPEL